SGDGLPVHLAVIPDLEPVEVDEPESVVRVRQPGCGSGPNLSLQDSFVRLGQRLGLNLPALLLLGVLLLAAFQLGLELLDLTPERAGLTLDLLLEVAVDLLELAGLGLPIGRLLGGVLVGLLGVVGSRLAGNSVVLRDLGRVSLSGRVRHQTVSPCGRLVKRAPRPSGEGTTTRRLRESSRTTSRGAPRRHGSPRCRRSSPASAAAPANAPACPVHSPRAASTVQPSHAASHPQSCTSRSGRTPAPCAPTPHSPRGSTGPGRRSRAGTGRRRTRGTPSRSHATPAPSPARHRQGCPDTPAGPSTGPQLPTPTPG